MLIKGIDVRTVEGKGAATLVIQPSDEAEKGGRFGGASNYNPFTAQELCIYRLEVLSHRYARKLDDNPELAKDYGIVKELAPGIIVVSSEFELGVCGQRDTVEQTVHLQPMGVVLEYGPSVEAAKLEAAQQLVNS